MQVLAEVARELGEEGRQKNGCAGANFSMSSRHWLVLSFPCSSYFPLPFNADEAALSGVFREPLGFS